MTGLLDNIMDGDIPTGDSQEESSLFGLDPLFWTHVPLFVRDVLALRRCGLAQVFAWCPESVNDVNDTDNNNNSRFLRLCQISGIVVGREDLTKCIRFLRMLYTHASCRVHCIYAFKSM